MLIKTVKVTNHKNVLTQIPGFVVDKWNLKAGDSVEVHISEDEQSIILKPRKGHVNVRAGSDTNKEGKTVPFRAAGCIPLEEQ